MSIEQNKQNKKQTQLNWWFIAIGSVVPIMIPFIKYFREQAKITPDSLDKQNLFWIAIFAPIVYFFLLGCVAWSGTEIDRSWNGFNKFLEISKLPIGILALSPIFGVFVSNVHRTIQTEKQISATEKQITIAEEKNYSDSFYAHKKYIIEEFNTINSVYGVEEKITIESPSILYKVIYHKSNVRDGFSESINPNYLKFIEDNFKSLGYILQEMSFKYRNDNYIGNSVTIDFFEKKLDELFEIINEIITVSELGRNIIPFFERKIMELKERKNNNLKNILGGEKSIRNEMEMLEEALLAKDLFERTIYFCSVIGNIFNQIFDRVDIKVDGHNNFKNDILNNLLPQRNMALSKYNELSQKMK